MERKELPRELFVWLIVPVIGLLIAAIVYPLAHAVQAKPHQYSLTRLKASNGVKLFTLPDNIALKAINQNVADTGLYGINGGFFYNGDLLSIAVMDDLPIKGAPHDYGTG